MRKNKIIHEVGNYYTKKILQHGSSPAGVDWNSQGSQELRFEQLLKVITHPSEKISILDYGCGYGALYAYMNSEFKKFNFTGFDISTAMIAAATKKYSSKNAKWIWNSKEIKKYDYVVSSGIFNVRFKNSNNEWLKYIIETLHKFNKHSLKGFSFNVLTKYSDKKFMKNNLCYADPCFLFDYCKKKFSRNVALLHDYQLYEFSIIVRKD